MKIVIFYFFTLFCLTFAISTLVITADFTERRGEREKKCKEKTTRIGKVFPVVRLACWLSEKLK